MHITSANLDARYSYTSDGRRLSKTVNGTTTYYLWDGTQLIAEYQNLNNQWQQTRRYDYLPGATTPQQMVDTTGVYTIISDHLDTPSLMLNDQNQVVWRQYATAFGEASIDNDVDGDGTHVTMNFRFPGQYFDQETGTHYNYFRTYDPRLGRYLQSDPIGLLGGVNTYAYVGGNPLKLIDPYGLKFCLPGWVVAGLSGGIGGAVSGGLIGGLATAPTGLGALAGLVGGTLGGFAAGFFTGAVTYQATQALGPGAGAIVGAAYNGNISHGSGASNTYGTFVSIVVTNATGALVQSSAQGNQSVINASSVLSGAIGSMTGAVAAGVVGGSLHGGVGLAGLAGGTIGGVAGAVLSNIQCKSTNSGNNCGP
ncbi:RHS repeat-associated core domain-containing protein [Agarilytica rhodophyticola]|uniref:RHS repeat-associated core domain-containing protein n=1 Tax=Agarilytica rhodophyticola TaxID=1737490 RepID=UPI000B34A037|nr:RHS repeat-associated core domain-containing protein [Agarilytica rhodophyticola]